MSDNSKSKSFKEGRNSTTGKFTTVRKARESPKTHQVEHVPKKGRGDTDRSKKKS